ncbi:aminopeptidase Ey-like isoform X2 [Periplaneta americana]|uniref:aminopeptidase Ey-like isoform X2 n=1 Tax=Periplaneta americana TaxID=6978 RepID=UPI0037E8D2E8
MYVHIATFLALVAATSCYFQPKDALQRDGLLRRRNLTRLPQSLRPSAYQLKVFPRIRDGYFNGSVLINVTCHESISTVILHAHEVLNIHQVNISIQSYAATINSLIFARQVFPCFDEPSFKASFQLSVARLSNMTTLSVMPRIATEPTEDNDYVWDHFPPTPPLSTFSINFIVHQLDTVKNINVTTELGNVSVNIYYQEQGPTNYTVMVNDSMLGFMINFMQDYLGIEYALSKLDIVKLPRFEVTAEGSTLGLVMLDGISPDLGTPRLAQEIVNQWINHMVTPQWWNEFALTDMLGNFLIHYIFNKVEVGWDRYTATDRTFLYELYSLSQSFRHRDWNPYSVWKDEWFLQMLNTSLTDNTVNKGIRNLFTKKKFKSFSGRELWDAINREARIDGTLADSPSVENIANSWLGRQAPHFPAVTVTRNYEDGSALLEQHLFLQDPHNATQEERDFVWWIPIEYLTPNNLDVNSIHPVSWMGERTHNIGNLPDMQSFVIMNPTGAGMFLVNYDQHNWKLISQNLQSSECKISKITHKKLLQDALSLYKAMELNISTALNLTLSLCNETDFSVWQPLVHRLFYIINNFEFTLVEDKLQVYLRRLLTPTFGENVPGERNKSSIYDYPLYVMSMREILNLVGNQRRINEIYTRVNNTVPTFPFMDNDTELLLHCPEFMKNISDDWIIDLNNLQGVIGVSGTLMKYLSKCPGFADLIEKILNALLNEGPTWKSRTLSNSVSLLTRSRIANNMTFYFVVENFNQLVQRYKASNYKYYISLIVRAVFMNIKTEEEFNKAQEFLQEYQNKGKDFKFFLNGISLDARNSFEKLQQQVPDLEKWLDQNLPTFKCSND